MLTSKIFAFHLQSQRVYGQSLPDFETETVPEDSFGFLQLAVTWLAVGAVEAPAGLERLADCPTFGGGCQKVLPDLRVLLEQRLHPLRLYQQGSNC